MLRATTCVRPEVPVASATAVARKTADGTPEGMPPAVNRPPTWSTTERPNRDEISVPSQQRRRRQPDPNSSTRATAAAIPFSCTTATEVTPVVRTRSDKDGRLGPPIRSSARCRVEVRQTRCSRGLADRPRSSSSAETSEGDRVSGQLQRPNATGEPKLAPSPLAGAPRNRC